MPARRMPVPTVVEVAIGPSDDMPGTHSDLVIAARAPVDLGRLIGLHPAYDVHVSDRCGRANGSGWQASSG